MVANLDGARGSFDAADRAAAPYDAPLRTASLAVEHAEDRLRTARRSVERAGMLRKRRPHAELANALEQHARASADLAHVQSVAKPFLDERRRTGDALDLEERAVRSFDRLSSMDGFERRHETVRALATGLSTWRVWASGRAIDVGVLIDCVTNLDATSNQNAHALADVVRSWADHNHLDLEPQRPQPVARHDSSIGIEL